MDNVVDPLAAYRTDKPKAKPRTFVTSFGLIEKGKRFQYRTVSAVKTSACEAVLLPSGKFVKLKADKIVRVKP